MFLLEYSMGFYNDYTEILLCIQNLQIEIQWLAEMKRKHAITMNEKDWNHYWSWRFLTLFARIKNLTNSADNECWDEM